MKNPFIAAAVAAFFEVFERMMMRRESRVTPALAPARPATPRITYKVAVMPQQDVLEFHREQTVGYMVYADQLVALFFKWGMANEAHRLNAELMDHLARSPGSAVVCYEILLPSD